jgi:amidophosphoribosyltransferase
MKKLVVMLKRTGVTEVHLRICSPPIRYSCYYGIDTPGQTELIASSHTIEEIKEYLQVNSLEYLTIDELRSVVKDPDSYCYACFSGEYPVPFLHDLSKSVLEDDAEKSNIS